MQMSGIITLQNLPDLLSHTCVLRNESRVLNAMTDYTIKSYK